MDLERVAGFEPGRTAWEAVMLPLHHTRKGRLKHNVGGLYAFPGHSASLAFAAKMMLPAQMLLHFK